MHNQCIMGIKTAMQHVHVFQCISMLIMLQNNVRNEN